MNGNDILVDTNLLLYFLGGNQKALELLQGRRLFLSVINEMELLSYPEITMEEELLVQEFLEHCFIVDMNASIKKRAIELRRKYRVKLPDAIVLSTANYLQIPLLTADKGFKKVEDEQVILFEFD